MGCARRGHALRYYTSDLPARGRLGPAACGRYLVRRGGDYASGELRPVAGATLTQMVAFRGTSAGFDPPAIGPGLGERTRVLTDREKATAP